MYEQIAANKRRSFFLIFFFVVLILLLGYLFGKLTYFGYFGVVIAALIAFLMVWGSYYYSDKIVLKMSRARPVEKQEYPHLYNAVEGISIAAGIPQPKMYVISDSAPNAFATGRNPQHAAVAVTTGLLDKLNRVELEGVIGHELSHIKNFDIRFATLVVVMVGVIVLLSDWMLRSFWFGGRDEEDSRSPLGLILVVAALILAVLAPLIAQLVRLAISRQREYLADASGAMLTRYPPGLASALEKIAADKEPLEVANKATAHLYIANPLKDIGGKVNHLFDTHPPAEERIKRLKAM